MDILNFDISIEEFYGTKALCAELEVLIPENLPKYLLDEIMETQSQDKIDYKDGRAFVKLQFTPVFSEFILDVVYNIDVMISKNSGSFSDLKDIITIFQYLQVFQVFDVSHVVFL